MWWERWDQPIAPRYFRRLIKIVKPELPSPVRVAAQVRRYLSVNPHFAEQDT
jgi:hypothetical protein